jgi:hypothetical protein
MVNFGFNSASILGIFLAVSGAGLYFMRTLRPELSRDHDIFFAAVGLLCGGILLWHGWRLDPILQFSQLLLAGAAIFFAGETIRLRGVATEQARRRSPIVDDERPSTRVYRTQVAQLDPSEDEEEYDNPRLQGSRDRTPSRRSVYEEEPPRTSRSRKPSPRYSDEAPQRSSRSQAPRRSSRVDDYWEETPDHWEEEPTPPRRSSPTPKGGYTEDRDRYSPSPSRKPKKRRPMSAEEIASSMGTEYVDYQPIDESDVNPQNPESASGKDLDLDQRRKPTNSPNFDY